MSSYYNYGNYGTYYVTYTTNTTSTWSSWSSNMYSNSTMNWDPPNKKKNHELTHLLRRYDSELERIKKLKRALGR